jgi:hypothetical protein
MPEPLHVHVEFDGSADPIAGTLTAGEKQLAFTGWLGLMAELQNAIGSWNQRAGEAGFGGATNPMSGAIGNATRTPD